MGDEDHHDDHHHDHHEQQDKLLPIANVGRIMKQILPPSAKISKEAKETMQECATEFISFVTGEATDKCQKDNRRTVNGDDICWALGSLGFDNYAEAMIRFLHKHREFEKHKLFKSKLSDHHHHDQFEASLMLFTPDELDHTNQPKTSIPFEFRFLDQGENSSINNITKPS